MPSRRRCSIFKNRWKIPRVESRVQWDKWNKHPSIPSTSDEFAFFAFFNSSSFIPSRVCVSATLKLSTLALICVKSLFCWENSKWNARARYVYFTYKYHTECIFLYFTVKLPQQYETWPKSWEEKSRHIQAHLQAMEDMTEQRRKASSMLSVVFWLIITGNHRPPAMRSGKIASCSPYWNWNRRRIGSLLSYCVALLHRSLDWLLTSQNLIVQTRSAASVLLLES